MAIRCCLDEQAGPRGNISHEQVCLIAHCGVVESISISLICSCFQVGNEKIDVGYNIKNTEKKTLKMRENNL